MMARDGNDQRPNCSEQGDQIREDFQHSGSLDTKPYFTDTVRYHSRKEKTTEAERLSKRSQVTPHIAAKDKIAIERKASNSDHEAKDKTCEQRSQKSQKSSRKHNQPHKSKSVELVPFSFKRNDNRIG